MSPRHPALLVLAVLAVVAAAGGAAADWPQFRHDDAHSGRADQAGVIENPYEPWTFSADGPVVSSPATAEVDGQRLAIFGSYPGQSTPGTLYAVDAQGNQVWSSQPVGTGGGYIASPTVEDVDADGGKEIVVATLDDSTVRMFDAATGDQEWATQVGNASEDLLASSPVVADVTDHSGKEILLGGSQPGYPGALFVFDTDGDVHQAVKLDGPAWSTPLVDDVDGDGQDEVALTTGVPGTLSQLFPNAKTGGQTLYAFEAGADGLSIKWSVTLDGKTIASPIAGDLDEDGETEVVVGDQSGDLWAVNGADGTVDTVSNAVGPLAALSSPVAADVDGDGQTEVAIGNYHGLRSLHLTAGGGWTLEAEVAIPKTGPEDNDDPWVGASLAVGDVDGDGGDDLVGMTVPINLTGDITNYDALPGRVFAVDGATLDAGGDTLPLSEAGLWSVKTPDDGGLGGPAMADLDGDGDSEVLAGEGVPLIGNGSTLHFVDAANPTIDGISTDPSEPTDLDDIRFQASVRDEDTDASDLSYDWSLGDGTTSSDAEPVHDYADDGTYTITVTVTDPDGHDWTADRSLKVRNVAPDVAPSADTTPGDLTVTLQAGASDADGTVESVSWELGDGDTASGSPVTHEYPTGGTYEANATAVDDDGDASTGSVTVHVNRFPNLTSPADATVDEGETLTLDFPWEDADGDAIADVAVANASGASATWNDDRIRVTWTPDYDLASLDDPTTVVPVDVTVADDGTPTGTDTARVNVTVENMNRAPDLGLPDDATVGPGQEADVNGSLADPDGDDLTLDAEGLPPNSTLSKDGDRWVVSVEARTPTERQEYEVNVSATDGADRGWANFTLTFLPNTPPTPVIELGAPMVNVTTQWDPASLLLNGSASSDPDGHTLTSFAWSVDGRTLSGPQVEVAFHEAGSADASLTVTDSPGLSASTKRTIPVDDALTGSLEVEGSGPPATGVRSVRLHVRRADGTAVGGTAVDVTLAHSASGVSTSKNVTTGPDGLAVAHFDGDGGTDVFLPGEHTVTASTSAPSRPGAVLDDTETLTMRRGFVVGVAP